MANSPDEGWLPWEGGECPVPRPKVEIQYRDGGHDTGDPGWFEWDHHRSRDDIIAYRIISHD
jgi:hypothetical protein